MMISIEKQASTSASAGLISLLNAARLAKPGGKPMGFLNPWIYRSIYSNADAFTDIVRGAENCKKCRLFSTFLFTKRQTECGVAPGNC